MWNCNLRSLANNNDTIALYSYGGYVVTPDGGQKIGFWLNQRRSIKIRDWLTERRLTLPPPQTNREPACPEWLNQIRSIPSKLNKPSIGDSQFIPEQFTVKAHTALFEGEGSHNRTWGTIYSSLPLTYTFKTRTKHYSSLHLTYTLKHKKTVKASTRCVIPNTTWISLIILINLL